MKPLVVELIEGLLRKGEVVMMTSSFYGNSVDVIIKSISSVGATAPTKIHHLPDSYCFHCEFFDENIEEYQEADEYRTEDELELMNLHKRGKFWSFY